DVDVRRAAGVGNRLDGPEVVFAGRTGREPAEALEVGIPLPAGTVGAVDVHSPVVYLPDLDNCVRDRAARGVEDLAAQVGNFANRGRDRVVDDEQVIISVERQLVRVERALGQSGRPGELFGKQGRSDEGSPPQRESAQE